MREGARIAGAPVRFSAMIFLQFDKDDEVSVNASSSAFKPPEERFVGEQSHGRRACIAFICEDASNG